MAYHICCVEEDEIVDGSGDVFLVHIFWCPKCDFTLKVFVVDDGDYEMVAQLHHTRQLFNENAEVEL